MFYVSSVLSWAVSLEVSHVVAVMWQLGLESSEVTVNAGCQQGTELSCQLECLPLDSPCGLGLVARFKKEGPKEVSPFVKDRGSPTSGI